MNTKICKYLLSCETDTINALHISIDDLIQSILDLRYWCYAEHVTPSGRNITVIFLWYRSCPEYLIARNDCRLDIFDCSTYSDLKPSKLIREYVKTKGFSMYLGKSRPIPGTFIEKKGGL